MVIKYVLPSGKQTVCYCIDGVEILDFPMKNEVDLSIVFCCLPGRDRPGSILRELMVTLALCDTVTGWWFQPTNPSEK